MLAGVFFGLGREKGCRPFPRTPFSAGGRVPTLCFGWFFLTNANTSCTIEVPASLRSERCSPSARNAVRVPFGISVRLRRNPHDNDRGQKSLRNTVGSRQQSRICTGSPFGSRQLPDLDLWRVLTCWKGVREPSGCTRHI